MFSAVEVTPSDLTVYATLMIEAHEPLDLVALAKLLQPVVVRARLEQEQDDEFVRIVINYACTDDNRENIVNIVRNHLDD